MDLYTMTVSITVFILIITLADVMTNRLIPEKKKHEIIIVCLIVFIASVCEYIGRKQTVHRHLLSLFIDLQKWLSFVHRLV